MNNPVEHFIIPSRFRGPEDSGNGGYVCGKLAKHLKGAVEVRLKKPPPLKEKLEIYLWEGPRAELRSGDQVIAEARPSSLEVKVPSPPSFKEAEAATANYLGLREHPFPCCFVCGPKREAGDGLQIFPGRLEDRALVAAPWIPDASLEESGGVVASEFLWAALDCPGAFAVLQDHFPPMVLGTLTVEIQGKLKVEEKAVVIGWEIGREGRKRFAGTALFNELGELVARGKAVWIELENRS